MTRQISKYSSNKDLEIFIAASLKIVKRSHKPVKFLLNFWPFMCVEQRCLLILCPGLFPWRIPILTITPITHVSNCKEQTRTSDLIGHRQGVLEVMAYLDDPWGMCTTVMSSEDRQVVYVNVVLMPEKICGWNNPGRALVWTYTLVESGMVLALL